MEETILNKKNTYTPALKKAVYKWRETHKENFREYSNKWAIDNYYKNAEKIKEYARIKYKEKQDKFSDYKCNIQSSNITKDKTTTVRTIFKPAQGESIKVVWKINNKKLHFLQQIQLNLRYCKTFYRCSFYMKRGKSGQHRAPYFLTGRSD